MSTGGGAGGGGGGAAGVTSAKECELPNPRVAMGPTGGGGAAGVGRTDRSADARPGLARMMFTAVRAVDDTEAGGGAAGAELVHPNRGSGPVNVGAGGGGAGSGEFLTEPPPKLADTETGAKPPPIPGWRSLLVRTTTLHVRDPPG